MTILMVARVMTGYMQVLETINFMAMMVMIIFKLVMGVIVSLVVLGMIKSFSGPVMIMQKVVVEMI